MTSTRLKANIAHGRFAAPKAAALLALDRQRVGWDERTLRAIALGNFRKGRALQIAPRDTHDTSSNENIFYTERERAAMRSALDGTLDGTGTAKNKLEEIHLICEDWNE